MDEKTLKAMAKTLEEIKGSLNVPMSGGMRGPVADPAPAWPPYWRCRCNMPYWLCRCRRYFPPWIGDPAPGWNQPEIPEIPGLGNIRGPVTDPVPEMGGYLQGMPQWGGFRGPVADPGPEWGERLRRIGIGGIRGPEGDPPPEFLLDKAKLAELKIHKIDAYVKNLQKEIDSLKLEGNLLRKEYKIK